MEKINPKKRELVVKEMKNRGVSSVYAELSLKELENKAMDEAN